jgi:hypothetical protein
VTEENAVRAMTAMAEQTEGLEVGKLILPENYLQEYNDFSSPKEEEEDPETGVDELTEEEPEEEIVESDGGSDYDDEDDGKTSGKGKARENVKKPPKPANGKKTKPKKPKPAGQVLNELVSYSCSRSRFWLMSHRSKKGTP